MRGLLDFFNSLKDTWRVLASVNRVVMSVDSLFVTLTWLDCTTTYLTQLGFFTAFGGLLGQFVSQFKVDWWTVVAGIVLYLGYRVFELAIVSVIGPRTRLFELSLSNKIEEMMLTKVAELDLGRRLDPSFVELQRLARYRGASATGRLWRAEMNFVGATLALAGGSVILLSLDPIIGILSVITAVPKVARDWFVEAKRRALDEAEALTQQKRAEAENSLLAPRAGLRSRLWQLNDLYLAYFRELTAEVRNNALSLARFDRKWNLVIGSAELGMLAILFFYFAWGFVEGKYSYLQLGAMAGSISVLVTGMHRFGSSLTQVEHARRDYAYFARLLEIKPLVGDEDARDFELGATPTIRIDSVSFTYPSTSTPVLADFSIEIAPGEKVALVGRNSAGKTTILRLVAKIYLPDKGSILVNGEDLRHIRQQSWLNCLLMAPQDLGVPGMELARALTGRVESDIDKMRLANALSYAGADDIVGALPAATRTWLGEQWPGGRGFSTGQLQRLALAGAFYRFLDLKMFIALFDEPMAHCDMETRARFYQAITRTPEFKDKTILVSMHDPLYLHNFDRVLFIDKGRVAKDLRESEQIAEYKGLIASTLAGDL